MKKTHAEILVKVALFAGILLFSNARESYGLGLAGFFLCLPAFWLLRLR